MTMSFNGQTPVDSRSPENAMHSFQWAAVNESSYEGGTATNIAAQFHGQPDHYQSPDSSGTHGSQGSTQNAPGPTRDEEWDSGSGSGSGSPRGSFSSETKNEVYVPKPKRTRKRKAKAPIDEETEKKKRDEYLVKNKQAAARCRAKKRIQEERKQDELKRLRDANIQLRRAMLQQRELLEGAILEIQKHDQHCDESCSDPNTMRKMKELVAGISLNYPSLMEGQSNIPDAFASPQPEWEGDELMNGGGEVNTHPTEFANHTLQGGEDYGAILLTYDFQTPGHYETLPFNPTVATGEAVDDFVNFETEVPVEKSQTLLFNPTVTNDEAADSFMTFDTEPLGEESQKKLEQCFEYLESPLLNSQVSTKKTYHNAFGGSSRQDSTGSKETPAPFSSVSPVDLEASMRDPVFLPNNAPLIDSVESSPSSAVRSNVPVGSLYPELSSPAVNAGYDYNEISGMDYTDPFQSSIGGEETFNPSFTLFDGTYDMLYPQQSENTQVDASKFDAAIPSIDSTYGSPTTKSHQSPVSKRASPTAPNSRHSSPRSVANPLLRRDSGIELNDSQLVKDLQAKRFPGIKNLDGEARSSLLERRKRQNSGGTAFSLDSMDLSGL